MMNEAKKTYEPVPEQMRTALAHHLTGLDFSNLFIEEGPDPVHHLGKIVRRMEKPSNEQAPQLTTDGAMIHSVVCSVLWLAREDSAAMGGKHMKDMYTEEQLALPANVTLVNDALSLDHLSHLRDETKRKGELGKYRAHSDALSKNLINAAVADLPTYHSKIGNSLVNEMGAEKYAAPKLQKNVALLQIYRAAQAMAGPALETLPESPLGSAGIYRDEHAKPVWYLWKLPKEMDENTILIILDPMLATGGTISTAIDRLKKEKIPYKEIRIVSQVAAPEGIATVNEKHPGLKIFAAAVDSHLNEHAYIVPGLGDAGDNYFGTTHS